MLREKQRVEITAAAVSKKDLRLRKSYWASLCKRYKIHSVVID